MHLLDGNICSWIKISPRCVHEGPGDKKSSLRLAEWLVAKQAAIQYPTERKIDLVH